MRFSIMSVNSGAQTIVYHSRAYSIYGETFICPITLALHVENVVHNLGAQWKTEQSTFTKFGGYLPFSICEYSRIIARDLLESQGFSIQRETDLTDDGISALVIHRLGGVINFLLYKNSVIFQNYTKETFNRSYSFLGQFYHRSASKNLALTICDSRGVTNEAECLLAIRSTLPVLVKAVQGSGKHLDRSKYAIQAFAYLAVLFSIPQPSDSPIFETLKRCESLRTWVEETNDKFDKALWVNQRSFCVGLKEDVTAPLFAKESS